MIGFVGHVYLLKCHCLLSAFETTSGSTQSWIEHTYLVVTLSLIELSHIVSPLEFCAQAASHRSDMEGRTCHLSFGLCSCSLVPLDLTYKTQDQR